MPDAVDRINRAVAQPYAGEHLHTYFRETGHIEGLPGFTGAWFERVGDPGPDDAFRLSGTDLVALSTLAVEVPAAVAIRLLHQHRPQIEELLARIPTDVAIWDADDADIGPHGAAEELWALIRRTGDRKDTANRRTSAFKLCARKRPALLPVYDTEVEHCFPPGNGNWWLTARQAMRQPTLRERLSALHRDAAVPSQVTLLRTLDVVLWMEARHRRGGNCGHFRS